MRGLKLGLGLSRGAASGRLSLAAIREQLAQQAGAVSLYLPSTYATSAWRRYDATTEIGMIGYPIGFLGDMLQGMELGPELITNGDFSAGTTGWSAQDSSLSISDGRLSVQTTAGTTGLARQPKPSVEGKFYRMASTLSYGNIAASRMVGTGSTYQAFITPYNFIRSRSTTLNFFCRTTGGVGGYSYHDNCSLREILGNHSSQETDGNRPSLLFNGSVYYLAHTSGQKLTAYVPSSLGATCTVIYASPGVGAQKLENIPVVSNAVDLTQNHSGLTILPSSATADQVARATAIMNQLAWRTAV